VGPLLKGLGLYKNRNIVLLYSLLIIFPLIMTRPLDSGNDSELSDGEVAISAFESHLRATVGTATSLTFAQAAQVLKGTFDLEAARTAAVREHQSWGLLQALSDKGLVKDADDYGALFDGVSVSAADLISVGEDLAKGRKMDAVFDPGALTPKESFDTLFAGTYREDSYAYRNLETLRAINPATLPGLERLHGQHRDDQFAAYKAAYEVAGPFQPTGPRLNFTPRRSAEVSLEVSNRAATAVEDLQAFANSGVRFLSPTADFIRCKGEMALNPDAVQATSYPDFAFSYGAIPVLRGSTARHDFGIFPMFPRHVSGNGSRIALG